MNWKGFGRQCSCSNWAHLPRMIDEDHEEFFKVWTRHLFNTRLDHYCCTSLFHISLASEDISCLLCVLYTVRHYWHAGSSRDCIWSQTCAWLQLIENTYISIGPSISILHTRIYHTSRGGTYSRTCQFISKTKMDTAVTSPVAELGRNSTSKGNDSRKVTWGNALICSCVFLKCAIKWKRVLVRRRQYCLFVDMTSSFFYKERCC